MSDTTLRDQVARLAAENPEMRKHLLPILKTAGGKSPLDSMRTALLVARVKVEGDLTKALDATVTITDFTTDGKRSSITALIDVTIDADHEDEIYPWFYAALKKGRVDKPVEVEADIDEGQVRAIWR